MSAPTKKEKKAEKKRLRLDRGDDVLLDILRKSNRREMQAIENEILCQRIILKSLKDGSL